MSDGSGLRRKKLMVRCIRARLGLVDWAVLESLMAWTDIDNGTAFPGMALIAVGALTHTRTASGAVKRLVDARVVSIERAATRTTSARYRVVDTSNDPDPNPVLVALAKEENDRKRVVPEKHHGGAPGVPPEPCVQVVPEIPAGGASHAPEVVPLMHPKGSGKGVSKDSVLPGIADAPPVRRAAKVSSKKTPKADKAQLPFRADAASLAVREGAGDRYVHPDVIQGGYAIQIEKAIRRYPHVTTWRLLGDWFGAGGVYRTEPLGPADLATGRIHQWMQAAKEWRDRGRLAVERGPAPPASPDAFAEATRLGRAVVPDLNAAIAARHRREGRLPPAPVAGEDPAETQRRLLASMGGGK